LKIGNPLSLHIISMSINIRIYISPFSLGPNLSLMLIKWSRRLSFELCTQGFTKDAITLFVIMPSRPIPPRQTIVLAVRGFEFTVDAVQHVLVFIIRVTLLRIISHDKNTWHWGLDNSARRCKKINNIRENLYED